MKNLSTIIAALFVSVLALNIAGCNTEREGKDYAILKSGQQVSAEMVGWVAVPNTTPKLSEDKGAGVKYAVLAGQNVVPENMNTWVAMPSTLFTKMSGIKVDEPKAGTSEKWVLKPEGKSVPKDKNGWIAVPPSSPEMETSGKKGLELGKVFAGNIIPKEMNGWVAVDPETLAKISEKYMMTGKGSKVSKE